MSISIVLAGMPEVVKRLEPGSLYGSALKRALEDTRDYGDRLMHKRVPKLTGALEAAIVTRIDSREVPLWASIEIPNMPTRNGFRYGGALEGSDRYHYRSGPYKGRTTKAWWSGARKLVQTYLRRRVRQLAADIERAWGNG